MSLAVGNRLLSAGAAVLLSGSLLAGTGAAAANAAPSPAVGATTSSAASSSAAPLIDPALRGRSGRVPIIVTESSDGPNSPASRALSRLGGTLTQSLPLIHGFAATLPARAVPALADVPGVRTVTLDGAMHVQSDDGTSGTSGSSGTSSPSSDGGQTSGTQSTTTTPQPDATPADPDTLPSVYRQVLGADALAARGADGHGVTVALLDTGVSPLPDVAGQIVPITAGAIGGVPASCVNLSGEATCDDQYGHGTFLAGLIAGNGASSHGLYRGTAPGARLLSLKIAGPDGSADVSKVLAAIQWVVSFRNAYGIRVLNLSLGTDSTQSYRVDPLNYAVEQAWKSGIVVDVAASNRGPGASTISKPGDDPYVLTVGAVDDEGTTSLADDQVPNFTSHGPTASDGLGKPDVVAPGAHLVSLAAPGATITTTFPSTMAAPYRRGSGTSMATAAVSGLVAAMLSADDGMTPDRVKFALMATARRTASDDKMIVGSGLLDGYAAMSAPSGLANQGLAGSDGHGSLAASRGHLFVRLDPRANNVVLDGDKVAQIQLGSSLPAPWAGTSWTGTSWTGTSWTGTSWTGTSWTGTSWTGTSWTGTSWTGTSWTGTSWTTNAWYGTSWTGGAWYGAWDQ